MAADGNASPCNGAESGKFRFGPLVWRASRERCNKKGTKAARSAKCNSGDSGVQMESSPPTSCIGHQADEEAESLRSADSSVRRTHSDLGGDEMIAQALGHWNGADSTDGTASVDSAAESSGSAHPHQYQRNVVSRSRKMTRYLAKTYLRRSASQPVVVSESGIPAGSDPHPPTPSNGHNDVISDSEDAGLCLSEDDLSDHSGRDGTSTKESDTLHRIEEKVVREEIVAAGFVLEAQADFLRNPKDTRDWNASPRAAAEKRGTSDRFVLKFVKPSKK